MNQAPTPDIGCSVVIHDQDSRFNGQVGVVRAIYQGVRSSHLVQFSDGWSAVFPVNCLEGAEERLAVGR
jgi:hypothetical protein